MKYVFYIIAIVVLIFGFFYYLHEARTQNVDNGEITYKDITPANAKKMMESDENTILLDVRTPEEYQVKHIPNSVLLPLSELEEKATSILEDKDANILVYCRSGNRSVTASLILIELGYTNVYNLGGIIDWPYETETGN